MTTAEFVLTWAVLEVVGILLATRWKAGDFAGFMLGFVLPIPAAIAIAILAGGVPL